MPSGGRTHTKDEPTENCIPRLFKKRADAVQALVWWLKGVSFMVYRDDTLETTKMPNRKIEEMEIVQVKLVEVLC